MSHSFAFPGVLLTNSSLPNNWTKNLSSSIPVRRHSKSRRLARRGQQHIAIRSREPRSLFTSLFDEVNTYLASAGILKPRGRMPSFLVPDDFLVLILIEVIAKCCPAD